MSEILSIDSPRWQAVGLVIDQNTHDLASRRYGLLNEIVSWFKVIELFREAEYQHMIERQPTAADRRQHRTWLAALIAEGERLVTEIETKGGLGPNEAGIKRADVEAAVEELHTTRREWHEELSPARKAELWKGVFHVVFHQNIV
jgi:hypothetical protein